MPQVMLPTRPARDYQRPAWDYMEAGGTHCLNCWHRRAGKDDFAMSWTSVAALTTTPGNYWHMLPEYKQARKALWEGVDAKTGKRRIDQIFPPEIVTRRRDNEMMLEFVNGATWQLLGSDRYDQLVGAGPKGLVMSELSLSHPNAWAYLRPMLLESGGWFIGNFTPRGKNHAHDMFEAAQSDKSRWFADKLTVYDTGVFTPQQMEEERAFYHQTLGVDDGDSKFRQEYLCDFNASIIGAYYAREMEEMERTKRIGHVPYDPGLPVFTAWDLGYGDATVIIFCQISGAQVRIIDVAVARGVGLDAYAKLVREKPYVYERHYLPHDADRGDVGIIGGKKRVEVLRGLGVNPVEVLDRELIGVDDGIQAVRRLLPRVVMDREACKVLIEAMRNYRRVWDAERRVFHNVPYHDWSSDFADAMRYLAMGLPDKFSAQQVGATQQADRYRAKMGKGAPRRAAGRSRWSF